MEKKVIAHVAAVVLTTEFRLLILKNTYNLVMKLKIV